jgi:hypothetical protein
MENLQSALTLMRLLDLNRPFRKLNNKALSASAKASEILL